MNPYAALGGHVSNPFAPQGWGQWRPPTDEFNKDYYERNPDEAYSLYAPAAGGSPGGSLEAFIRRAFGDVWAKHIRANMQPGGEGLMFSDALTPELRNQQWQMWRAQTPDQRNEHHATLGAGRYS